MKNAAPCWGAGTGHGLHLDARLMPFKTCPPPDGHLTDCQPVRGAKGALGAELSRAKGEVIAANWRRLCFMGGRASICSGRGGGNGRT